MKTEESPRQMIRRVVRVAKLLAEKSNQPEGALEHEADHRDENPQKQKTS